MPGIEQTLSAFYPHRPVSFSQFTTGNLWESKSGEGKRRKEFVEWYVEWRAEWYNYAKYDLRGK